MEPTEHLLGQKVFILGIFFALFFYLAGFYFNTFWETPGSFTGVGSER